MKTRNKTHRIQHLIALGISIVMRWKAKDYLHHFTSQHGRDGGGGGVVEKTRRTTEAFPHTLFRNERIR